MASSAARAATLRRSPIWQKARVYKCNGKHPKQKFSLKVGTVFEDSPIPLEKWLPALWLMVSCKNGVQLLRDSPRFGRHPEVGLVHAASDSHCNEDWRIRPELQAGGADGGPVEVDETFIGGKLKNMHKDRSKVRYRDQRGGATWAKPWSWGC